MKIKINIKHPHIQRIPLSDGYGETGGLAYLHETLGNFAEDTTWVIVDIKEVNKTLKECGIMPLTLKDLLK